MSDVRSKDVRCLLNIIEAIEKIQAYVHTFSNADDFFADVMSFDATLMNFIVIGEMTSKLSEGFIRETGDLIDWYKMKGFRNIIAHNYFGIDAEEVWQIIQNNLPQLKIQLLQIVAP